MEFATDAASTLSVLKHVLEVEGQEFDNVVLLQPTNPLRPKNLLKEAFNKFKKGNFDNLITVSSNHQKFGKITDGKYVPYNYSMGQRSQDLDPLYFENGLLYIYKAKIIISGNDLGLNNFPFIVDHPFSNVDIDTEEDFEYAKFILNKYL